jgi:hypothetical protein
MAANAPSVIEIDPSDPRWDAFVRAHPEATVYHLSAWAEILRRAYGYRPRYIALAGPDPDRLEGVLPLIMTRGVVSGRRLRSLPVVNAAGPLAADAEGLSALLRAACDRASEDCKVLLVRSRRAGLEALAPNLASVPKHPTWIAPVPSPEEHDLKAWKKHSRNLYRGVNKALVAGLTFREAEGPEDLRRWYKLYLATMRKRGTLPRTWRQLETTRRLLEPSGEFRLFVVEQGDRMLAGVVSHPFGDTVELVYNGSDPEALELRPNHLLNWSVLGWASQRGYSFLDIGDAREGGPLANFKAQFKAEPVPDYRYDCVIGSVPGLARARAVGHGLGAPDATGPAARAWARLPLLATHAAAAIVYRFA